MRQVCIIIIIIIIIMCLKATLGPQFVHKISTAGPFLRLVLTFTEDQTFWGRVLARVAMDGTHPHQNDVIRASPKTIFKGNPTFPFFEFQK